MCSQAMTVLLNKKVLTAVLASMLLVPKPLPAHLFACLLLSLQMAAPKSVTSLHKTLESICSD